MSDTVILAIIALIGTIVSSSITGFVYIKLGRVETKVDGKMDKLLEVSIGRALAEGKASGEQSERDRGTLPPTAGPTPVTVTNRSDDPVPVQTTPKP